MALSQISGTTGIADTTITSAKLADFSAAVDLNGVELLLDADQDTSITADTDDVVDFTDCAEAALSLETQELLNSLLIELCPESVDQLEDEQFVRSHLMPRSSHAYMSGLAAMSSASRSGRCGGIASCASEPSRVEWEAFVTPTARSRHAHLRHGGASS